MSGKYNPRNDQHRYKLAANILELLTKWGFSIDKDLSTNAWEFICSKQDKYNPNKTVIIFTSIEKHSGVVRHVGKDMIRVIVKYSGKDQHPGTDPRFYRIASIKRTGKFYKINDRICAGIIQAQQHKRRKYEN